MADINIDELLQKVRGLKQKPSRSSGFSFYDDPSKYRPEHFRYLPGVFLINPRTITRWSEITHVYNDLDELPTCRVIHNHSVNAACKIENGCYIEGYIKPEINTSRINLSLE